MKLIDFDQQFQKYVAQWVKDNRSKYKNMDELEEQVPELYLRWLNEPADFIGGATPGLYFSDVKDPAELIDLLKAYDEQGISVPDLLLESITSRGEAIVPALMALAREDGRDVLNVTAINSLIEIGSTEPMAMCIDLIAGAKEANELTDVSAELLQNIGRAVVNPILERMDACSPAAQETFLDVLCNFPGDERIYNYVTEAFKTRYDRRALFASYLAKLGDDRALPMLKDALTLSDLNYLDYIEIVGAIESLGGEVDETRDFTGDPYYESLRKMQ